MRDLARGRCRIRAAASRRRTRRIRSRPLPVPGDVQEAGDEQAVGAVVYEAQDGANPIAIRKKTGKKAGPGLPSARKTGTCWSAKRTAVRTTASITPRDWRRPWTKPIQVTPSIKLTVRNVITVWSRNPSRTAEAMADAEASADRGRRSPAPPRETGGAKSATAYQRGETSTLTHVGPDPKALWPVEEARDQEHARQPHTCIPITTAGTAGRRPTRSRRSAEEVDGPSDRETRGRRTGRDDVGRSPPGPRSSTGGGARPPARTKGPVYPELGRRRARRAIRRELGGVHEGDTAYQGGPYDQQELECDVPAR